MYVVIGHAKQMCRLCSCFIEELIFLWSVADYKTSAHGFLFGSRKEKKVQEKNNYRQETRMRYKARSKLDYN